MSAETMGTIIQTVLIVGAVVCIGFVLAVTGAALCIVYLFIRTVYRAVTGQPLFPDEPERDLSDVMMNDFGDTAVAHAPDLYVIPAKRPT
jgi:hypothetical protein